MPKMLIYSWCMWRQDFKSKSYMEPIFYLTISTGSIFDLIQIVKSITLPKLLSYYVNYLWLHHQISSEFDGIHRVYVLPPGCSKAGQGKCSRAVLKNVFFMQFWAENWQKVPYARGRGFDSRSRLLFIVWTNLSFSSFFLFISNTYLCFYKQK
jgi:hypothetical protein